MNPLLLSAEYPPMEGGVGDYTRRLALALHQQGQSVGVLTSAGAIGLPDDPLPVYPVVPRWGWGCLPTIRAFLRRHPLDLLHLQYQTGAFRMHPAIHFLPDLLRRLPVPPRLVVTMHDLRLPYLFPKAGRLRHRIVARLLRGADAVVVTNGADLERLQGAGRPAQDHLDPLPPGWLRSSPKLVPLGSSLEPPPPGYDRDAWRTRLGVSPGEVLLGHFGLLHPSKGADLLVQATARLRRAGRPVRLLFVGGEAGTTDVGGAAFAADLRQQVERLGMTDVVGWTGSCPAEDAAGYLLACDVVVLPYRDGASFRRSSLVAALTLGCAVVTTTPASLSAVSLGPGEPLLEAGLHAALVPPADEAALTRALAGLLEDSLRRQRLAEGARQLGETFRWDQVGRRMRALYDALL